MKYTVKVPKQHVAEKRLSEAEFCCLRKIQEQLLNHFGLTFLDGQDENISSDARMESEDMKGIEEIQNIFIPPPPKKLEVKQGPDYSAFHRAMSVVKDFETRPGRKSMWEENYDRD